MPNGLGSPHTSTTSPAVPRSVHKVVCQGLTDPDGVQAVGDLLHAKLAGGLLRMPLGA